MKNKSTCVGIHGIIDSGKDTVAAVWQYLDYKHQVELGNITWLNATLENFIKGNGNSKWENKKFSYKLKKFIADILSVPLWKLEDRVFKESTLGPEWNRFFIWDQINDQLFSEISLSSHQEALNYISSMSLKKCKVVELPMTVRMLMQEVATEGIRDTVHSDMWVNGLFSEYTPQSKWLITDLRFPNEHQRIDSVNGLLIKVINPHNTTDIQQLHYSERALVDHNFEHYIQNDKTKGWDYLIDQVYECMSGYGMFDE